MRVFHIERCRIHFCIRGVTRANGIRSLLARSLGKVVRPKAFGKIVCVFGALVIGGSYALILAVEPAIVKVRR